MAALEHEEENLRPACAACTFRCNSIHGDRDPEEEKFDPDRSWPQFGRKVTKMSSHHSPQAALCIPGAFMEEYPNVLQKGKPVTLEGPSGNKWNVGATDRSILHAGWRAFAHDHHLREGDQLHFRLTKPSHFVVDIFNSHGEIRRSARKAIVTGKYAVAAPGTPALQVAPSKKRKGMADMHRGVATIGDLLTMSARRGNLFSELEGGGPRLRFSEKTKQWERESHEEKEHHPGHETVQVVTIDLDSDEEEPAEAVTRPRSQFYKSSSKIGRLVEHMEEEGNLIAPQLTPPVTHVIGKANVDANLSQQENPGDGEDDDAEQESARPADEEKQRAGNPVRQFTSIFDTSPMDTLEDLHAAQGVAKAKKTKLESASDPLSREAQLNCDEDVVMVKVKEEQEETDPVASWVERSDEELDETSKVTEDCVVGEKNLETGFAEKGAPIEVEEEAEEKHESNMGADKALPRTAEQGISGNYTNAASEKGLQSDAVSVAHETAADYESVAHKADDAHVGSSHVTSIAAMSVMSVTDLGIVNGMAKDVGVSVINGSRPQEEMQETAEGVAVDSVAEFPAKNTINGGQTESVHSLKESLKSHEQADDFDALNHMEDELFLTKSKNSDCILNTTHSSKRYTNCDLDVTMIEPAMEQEKSPSSMPASCDAERTNGKEIILLPHDNISNPEATPDVAHEMEKNNNTGIQASLTPMSKTYPNSNTCELGSKRGRVAQIDREKALKAAQALAAKIRHPNFVAVMESSHVYTGFNLDIPAEFGKQSKLPATEVRVTLVCNEVPTNCKAMWVGKDPEHPMLESKGWMNFSRNHFLEEGDVCVFECSSRATFRIGVHIFRVVRLKKPVFLDWTRHYEVLKAAAGTPQAEDVTNSEEKASPPRPRSFFTN